MSGTQRDDLLLQLVQLALRVELTCNGAIRDIVQLTEFAPQRDQNSVLLLISGADLAKGCTDSLSRECNIRQLSFETINFNLDDPRSIFCLGQLLLGFLQVFLYLTRLVLPFVDVL